MTFRTLRLLLLGAFLFAALKTPAGLAGESAGCDELSRAKWGPRRLGDDFHALVLEVPMAPASDISMTSCWTCGLWAEAFSSYPGVPDETTEALLYQRALCYRSLGMQKEALGDCRRILRQYPTGNTVPRALQSILEVLAQQGNYKAVVDLFHDLGPDHRKRLLSASLYLIAQSFYILGQDEPAEGLLTQVPSDAEIYPYALYTLAQVFYRKGDSDRALLVIRVIHESPPGTNVPQILREMAWLTEARMLYQQKSYEKAIDAFRNLSQSSYLLPEALMGMGWCHKALGDYAKSVAYFQAVEASYADGDTMTEAYLEMADAFSRAKTYQDAFQTYRSILNHLHFRISQYKKYGGDPEWLTWLTERFLDRPGKDGEGPVEVQMMDQEADLPAEMEPLLEREKYTSPRMKELLEIREGLEQISIFFDKLAYPVDPEQLPTETAPYPPLGVTVPALEPRLGGLLDLYFALLDTEYRLVHAGSMLGLLERTERTDVLQDCLAFYRTELKALLLSEHAGQDAHEALTRLQSTVRYLPFSLQEKETVLTKLLYMMQSLREAEETLEQWAKGVQEISASETQPTRFLLLEKWMTLVRVFLYLRGWDGRSPTVFLLDDPSLSEYRSSPVLSSQETLIRVSQRMDIVWQRLAVLVKREIANLHVKRLDILEGFLTRTQFDYADALVREQERILETMKTLPPEDGGEEAPEAKEIK